MTGVSKRYRGNRASAISDLSFTLYPGAAVALLGANGAGKTTTVRLIAGLMRPDVGSIRVFGLNPRTPLGRAHVAYVPEQPGFPGHLTAPEVMGALAAVGRSDRSSDRQRVLESLEWAGLRDIRRPIRAFSKGMRQSLALAQALLAQPSLMILDEPTSDLDPPATARVRELVLAVAERGGIVLLNSHRLEDVRQMCSRVLLLRSGRLLVDLSLKELHRQGRSLEELFEGAAKPQVPRFIRLGEDSEGRG